MKRFNLILLTLWLPLLIFAQTASDALGKFIRTNGIRPESVAVKITSLSDGETIAQHNTSSPLTPASIMKSVTTAALLEKGGMDYLFHTRVYIDGPLDMGILRGNLIIEGGGDPTINSYAEPFGEDLVQEVVDALKTAGINRIEGKIIIDQSQFAGPGRPSSWMPADFKESYGTAFHAFNFQNNAAGKRSVENPAAVFTTKLKTALAANHILLDSKDDGVGARTMIFEHLSPPVDEIMRSCMMRSDNLFAEAMLRAFGKLEGGDGSVTDAAKREYQFWQEKDMPLDGVSIIDGSGLSRENRVTADFMTGVLKDMSHDANYASFFPLAGQEGTLRRFLAGTALDSYIAMKTGSMKGIQCYAGYLLDDDYVPTHTVVIIMNDITKSRDRAKKAAETMLLEIFKSRGVTPDEATPQENADEENEQAES